VTVKLKQSRVLRLMLESWTKLITKSGPKFNMVMQRMNKIKIKEIADQYFYLRQVVINAKLELFGVHQGSWQMNTSVPVQGGYFQPGYPG
jgi:hypothetical protein